MIIVPTIGRVLWYYPNGKTQLDAGEQPHAAHVAYVHGDRCVNIAYFDQNGFAKQATSVQLVQDGDAIPTYGFCVWMPFQKGQALKTEAVEKSLAAKCAVALVAVFALAASALASDPPAARLMDPPAAYSIDPPAALVEAPSEKYDAKGACVRVAWKQWGGSGTCVACENGKSLVLTCNHVFDESGGSLAPYPLSCSVTVAGKKYPAQAVSGDHDADLAIVVVEGALPVAAIADEVPAVGTKVWRSGIGSGYQTGTVRAPDMRFVNSSMHFVVEGASESGDSGAGYFNAAGELVAVHCGKDTLNHPRGTPVTTVKTVVRTHHARAFPHLFPRLRDRLAARSAANAVPSYLPDPPAAAPAPKAVPAAPKKVTADPVSPCPAAVCPLPSAQFGGTVYSYPGAGSSCVNGSCSQSSQRRGLFRR